MTPAPGSERIGPENAARIQQWMTQLALHDLQFVMSSAAVELLNRMNGSMGRAQRKQTGDSDAVVVCFAAGDAAQMLDEAFEVLKAEVVAQLEDQG